MQIEKKHIIIAIVAFVAVYLLWKKGVFGKKDSDEAVAYDAPKADTFEQVISASGMTTADAEYVRQLRKKIEASSDWRTKIELIANGLSYEQNLVLNAIWTKYYDNATSDFKDGINDTTKSYVWKVQSNIKNM